MATAKQPFGNPNLPKKTETSSAPKKSTVREQCKNMFLDALKETPNYPEENYKELAESIETQVYQLYNSDSSKNYRDKINAMKMKLKGARNQALRQALLDSKISPSQLVTTENTTELLEQSNSSIKPPEIPQNIPPSKTSLPPKNIAKAVPPMKYQPPPISQPLQNQPINMDTENDPEQDKPTRNPPKQQHLPITMDTETDPEEHKPIQKVSNPPKQQQSPPEKTKTETKQKTNPVQAPPQPKTQQKQEKKNVNIPAPQVIQKEKPQEKNQVVEKSEPKQKNKAVQPEKQHPPITTIREPNIHVEKQQRVPEKNNKQEARQPEFDRREQDLEFTNQRNKEETEQDDLERELDEFERMRKIKKDLEEIEVDQDQEDVEYENPSELENQEVSPPNIEYNREDNEENPNENFESNNENIVIMDSKQNDIDDNNENPNNYEDQNYENDVEGEGNYQNEYPSNNDPEQNYQEDYPPPEEENNNLAGENYQMQMESEQRPYEEQKENSVKDHAEYRNENENEELMSNQAIFGSKEGYNFSHDDMSQYRQEGEDPSAKNEQYEEEEKKEEQVEEENPEGSKNEEREDPENIQVENSPEQQKSPQKNLREHHQESPPKIKEHRETPQKQKKEHQETTHKDSPHQEFIKVMHLELELATEKQKNQYAMSQIEQLKTENGRLKGQLDEALVSLAQKEDVESLKRNYTAKERECEVLKQELNNQHQELNIMKTHLNKMIEENSRFKDDYMNFKNMCDQENITLRNEVAALKNKETDDKIIEIETLKSSNHILEEKVKILTQKLDISRKDCSEKESLLKKMATISALNENDFQLFHNLTSELQKQSSTLQNFYQNDQTFKNQQISYNFEAKKESLNVKHVENQTKVKEYPPKPTENPIENQQKPIETHQKPPENVKKPVESPPLPLVSPQKPIENQAKREEIPRKEQAKPIQFEENKEIHGVAIPQEKDNLGQVPSPNKIKEETPKEQTKIETKPEESVNVNKLIEPPPPQSFKKKLEEKRISPPVANPNRNQMPPTFNHPKLASRNVPVTLPPKTIEPKKIFSNANEGDDPFFSSLSNNSQNQPSFTNPQVPFQPQQIEKQSNPHHHQPQPVSDIFNQQKPNEDLKKSSPQKNIFVTHNEKETFKTINPNLFGDQKDDFANLIPVLGQPQKNEKKEVNPHIPKQSSNKNLPTVSQSNRQVGQNQNVQTGSMVRGAPNMESTTSLHSAMTEGEIKKGVGVRKGVIPGGLFD